MLSVAPDDWLGTMGRPGKRACTALATAFIRSGRSGEGGLSIEPSSVRVTVTPRSFTSSPSVPFTLSDETPGKIRQFTFALAFCGGAWVACPPLSMVATQVVWRAGL